MIIILRLVDSHHRLQISQVNTDRVQAVPRLHQLVVSLGLHHRHDHLRLGLNLGLRLPRHAPLHVMRNTDLFQLNSVDYHTNVVNSELKLAN